MQRYAIKRDKGEIKSSQHMYFKMTRSALILYKILTSGNSNTFERLICGEEVLWIISLLYSFWFFCP